MKTEMSTALRTNGVPPSAFRRKLEIFMPLSPAESEFVAALESIELAFPPGTDIARDGDAHGDVYVLKKGWAVRYKTLENGSRMIVDFILPGDFASPAATVFTTADYSVTTITQVSAIRLTVAQIVDIFNRFPKLAMAIGWFSAREGACLIERLISLGRRSAYQRLAHLLLELWQRQEIVGSLSNGRLVLPITQLHLADSLGLSAVHVNRMLRRLRKDSLVQVRRGEVVLADIEGLKKIAGFDDAYLHFEGMPKRTAMAYAAAG